jgi:hypothetical protein
MGPPTVRRSIPRFESQRRPLRIAVGRHHGSSLYRGNSWLRVKTGIDCPITHCAMAPMVVGGWVVRLNDAHTCSRCLAQAPAPEPWRCSRAQGPLKASNYLRKSSGLPIGMGPSEPSASCDPACSSSMRIGPTVRRGNLHTNPPKKGDERKRGLDKQIK